MFPELNSGCVFVCVVCRRERGRGGEKKVESPEYCTKAYCHVISRSITAIYLEQSRRLLVFSGEK